VNDVSQPAVASATSSGTANIRTAVSRLGRYRTMPVSCATASQGRYRNPADAPRGAAAANPANSHSQRRVSHGGMISST